MSWSSRVPEGPLFLWMREVIRVANDSPPVFSIKYKFTQDVAFRKCFLVWSQVFMSKCMCVFLSYYVISLRVAMKCFWETCLSEDSHIFTTAMISLGWSPGWCDLPFSEFRLCFLQNISWLGPAASPVALNFVCFPPKQRQHCLLVWHLSWCQLQSCFSHHICSARVKCFDADI